MTTMHPKVRAAAATTPAVAILAYLLRLAGVDVDAIPAEVLLLAAGALTTFAAWLRRAGLRGAVRVVLEGDTSALNELLDRDQRANQLRLAWNAEHGIESPLPWGLLQASEQERWRREAAS